MGIRYHNQDIREVRGAKHFPLTGPYLERHRRSFLETLGRQGGEFAPVASRYSQIARGSPGGVFKIEAA